jgi:voltage-gated potassium channel
VGVVSFIAALGMLDAERDNPTANIHTFGDAVWWAAATVPTVGYGDHYPVTTQGRWIAVG